jgi:hypothetical protein
MRGRRVRGWRACVQCEPYITVNATPIKTRHASSTVQWMRGVHYSIILLPETEIPETVKCTDSLVAIIASRRDVVG